MVCAALLVGACSSLDQFDVELVADGVIRGTLSSAGDGFQRFPGGTEVSQKIRNQGAGPGDVKSARLTAGTLSVTDPPGETLRYLESFEIFVEAPGLPRRRIAHQDAAFAARLPSHPLVLDDVELAPYITAESMMLTPKISFEGASRPRTDVAIRAALTLHVDLTLLD